jgi:hypothetical protein
MTLRLLQGAAHGRQWAAPELLRAWASQASVRPVAESADYGR